MIKVPKSILIGALIGLCISEAVVIFYMNRDLQKMTSSFQQMNDLYNYEHGNHLVVLKRIKDYFEKTDQGSSMLNKIIKVQESTVEFYLNKDSTSDKAKTVLSNSLKCNPPSCELNTPNQALKAQPSAAGTPQSGAP